jgi:hypothetical protein
MGQLTCLGPHHRTSWTLTASVLRMAVVGGTQRMGKPTTSTITASAGPGGGFAVDGGRDRHLEERARMLGFGNLRTYLQARCDTGSSVPGWPASFVVRIRSSCVVADRGWPCSACRIRRGLAGAKRSVRRYARRASSSRTGWAMPSSCTSPSSTKVTPWGGARWTTGSLTRTRLALA